MSGKTAGPTESVKEFFDKDDQLEQLISKLIEYCNHKKFAVSMIVIGNNDGPYPSPTALRGNILPSQAAQVFNEAVQWARRANQGKSPWNTGAS